jgi:hypothetical protein
MAYGGGLYNSCDPWVGIHGNISLRQREMLGHSCSAKQAAPPTLCGVKQRDAYHEILGTWRLPTLQNAWRALLGVDNSHNTVLAWLGGQGCN